MIMITLSTFLAVIVINLYFRGEKKGPLPPQIRRVSDTQYTVLTLTLKLIFKFCLDRH